MDAQSEGLAEAEAALARRDFERAEAFALRRLERNPSDLEALLIHGDAANETSRFIEAGFAFKRALTLQKDNVRALTGLAIAALGGRETASALTAAKHAHELAPEVIGPLLPLGPAAISERDQETISLCFRLLKGADKDTGVRLIEYWSASLAFLDRFDDAVRIYRTLMNSMTPTADQCATFGNYLLYAHQLAEARHYIALGLRLDPNHAGMHILGARRALLEGDLEAALQAARASLRCDPNAVSAYTTIAEVAASSFTDEDIQKLRELVGGAATPTTRRVAAGRSLGMALEARDAIDEAFAAFSAAAEMDAEIARRAGREYDPRDTERRVEVTKKEFAQGFLPRPHPAPDRGGQFIFVLGLLRSGTTLVDQILASHSLVESVGESHGMGRVFERFNARLRQSADPVRAIVEQHAAEWEKVYRTALNGADERARFVVDKMPSNFWNIGLISLLFPAAKIILLRRDPMDVCLSVFRNQFRLSAGVPIRLEDIGHFHTCFEAVCRHWLSVAPDRILVVEYERLLDAFEPGVGKILSHCGLAVEPACLKFHETKRPVYTLSAAQVRRGVYTSARGRWRRYEKHLGPLKAALGQR